METKTFSTNSFTYRFLAWPQAYIPRRNIPDDICDLRRAVIGKSFLYLVGVSVLLFYVYSLASFGLYTLSHHFDFLSAYSSETFAVQAGRGFFVGTVIVTAIIGSIYGFVACGIKLEAYLKKRRAEREEAGIKPLLYPVTSPIKEMYQSWKDKLCYRVKFE